MILDPSIPTTTPGPPHRLTCPGWALPACASPVDASPASLRSAAALSEPPPRHHHHLLLVVLWLACMGSVPSRGATPTPAAHAAATHEATSRATTDHEATNDEAVAHAPAADALAPPGPPPPFQISGPAPAPTHLAKVRNETPTAFSAIFNETNLLFASTNLTRPARATSREKLRAAEIADNQQRLENGRRLRQARLFDEATPQFVAVLNSDAPEELKRSAMLELALSAQEQNQLTRTLQILSQYLSRWPKDPAAPEIMLREGLIYRQLGTHNLALSKFYSTMTTALVLKDDHFDYYRKLVLQAQAEIAETLALQNKHAEAADAFSRLLLEESPALNRERVHYRYIHSLAAQGKHAETVGQAQDFLTRYGSGAEQAEVRFLLVTALKKLGRNQEALQEVLRLLQSQQSLGREDPATLAYWQQRTGNEIANQLYQEGDLVHALDIYQSLVLLNPAPAWRCPVQYQVGLVYERLEQPAKALETYGAIVAAEKELGTNAPPSLKTMIDMARWRQNFLQWQMKTEVTRRELKTPFVPGTAAAAGAPAPASPGAAKL